MLIVFGGLPGTGKTTLARAFAQRRRATYLRIDTIEQALRSSEMLAGDVGQLAIWSLTP
jgi:predicted kinase